jgi:hypothetical protein
LFGTRFGHCGNFCAHRWQGINRSLRYAALPSGSSC